MRQKRGKGEIVEVEGGRLVRSLGRKDRHSKVCTAKGPKDRRVRLSANTAIRFYDVQDRLGYDRPSKAIDWLMKEAKGAIEALNYDHELPAKVSNTSNVAVTHAPHQTTKEPEEYKCAIHAHPETPENRIHNEQCYDVLKDGTFGVFNDYPESLNIRNRSQAQDLALSLQSFQENHLLLQDSLFSALTPLDFEGTEVVQFEKMFTWDPNVGSDDKKESVQGFAADSLPRHLEPFSGQNQIFSQREPLQSSFLPSIHAASMPATKSYGTAFANDEFLGFSLYPQIQGQEEEEDNLVSKELSYETSLMYYRDF